MIAGLAILSSLAMTGEMKADHGGHDEDTRLARGWFEWGQNPQHSGSVAVVGQSASRELANITFDPFAAQELAENSVLLAHDQAALTDGRDVFMESISGKYVSCNPPGSYSPFPCGNDNWFNQVWNEKRLQWRAGRLVERWSFASDWKPAPDAGGELGGWRPVFHAALTDDAVWVPGAGGTVFKVSRRSGHMIGRLNPFPTIDPNTFVSGPITVDRHGNVYYNVLKLDITADPNTNDPWAFGPHFDGTGVTDIPDAWLVKISQEHDEDGERGDDEAGASTIRKVSYKSLTFSPAAPATCKATFTASTLPWPPSPTATPRTVPCLSQRPGLNITPAVAPDGTIYSVTVAHNPFASRYAYVVALNPDLSLKWTASLRGRIRDGCGVLLPIGGPGGCRAGQPANGVDPATNELPAGRVIDQSSSSPVVTPDGGVVYGAYSRYNFARGHTFRFDSAGHFVAAYDSGWDVTPAIHRHDGTYSIVIKDNHYDAGSYCNDPNICPVAPKGPYFITQVDPDMHVEWQFQDTSTDATHSNGFEWHFNAPAVDALGNVYANNADGRLYVVGQGGAPSEHIFLNATPGADTPVSLGGNGKIYTLNDGLLFAVGN